MGSYSSYFSFDIPHPACSEGSRPILDLLHHSHCRSMVYKQASSRHFKLKSNGEEESLRRRVASLR